MKVHNPQVKTESLFMVKHFPKEDTTAGINRGKILDNRCSTLYLWLITRSMYEKEYTEILRRAYQSFNNRDINDVLVG